MRWPIRAAAAGAGLTAALVSAEAATAQSPDVAAGERLFDSQCAGCHSLEAGRNRAGPTLHGLFERRSGTVEDFDYSVAMTEADIAWGAETLDEYLADPDAMVPGTRMVLWGLETEQRRQLIAYLEEATR